MVDICIPAALRHARSSFRYIDNTGSAEAAFSKSIQTTALGGDRVGATIEFTPHGGRTVSGKSERAQLLASLMSLRGKQNRVFVGDNSNPLHGSFPAPELFSNADFSNGATGWTADQGGVLSVDSGLAKLKYDGSGTSPEFYQAVAGVQWAPYVLRSFILSGTPGLDAKSIGRALTLSGSVQSNDYSSTRGYAALAGVLHTASALAQFPAVFSSGGSMIPGAYVSIPFTSFSRCMLADGGANLLLYSNSLSNAAWSKSGATGAGDNGTAAPDGTTHAEYIQEQDTANREHYVTQSFTVTSAAQDITLSCSAKANSRNFVLLRLAENTGTTYAYAWFNVLTGAIGTLTPGTNWSNLRAHITSQGGGWYRCSLTARKTNAATSLSVIVQSATADSVTSYAGTVSAVPILLFEISAAPGEVPSRGASTVGVAAAAASQPGAGLFVKGLPASTNGLLLPGDWFECDKQLKVVTAPLDSDGSGLGYLQSEPAYPRAIADNTPIIVNAPMCKMLLSDDVEYEARPGGFTDFHFEFVQDLNP